jgi:hypothetical protein
MKSLKDFKGQINEVLGKSDPIETWIHDFVHSTNPKFAGKSKAERINMAKGAYYGAQKESVEIKEDHEKDWHDMNDSWKEHHKHISNSYTDYFDKDKRAKHLEKAKKVEDKVRAKHGDKVADDMVKHSDAVVGSFDGPDGGRSEFYRAKAYRNRHNIHHDDQYDHNPDEHGLIKESVNEVAMSQDMNVDVQPDLAKESRGHKIIAAFLKNREVAQRAFNKQDGQDNPADKGIETPEKDAEQKKKMMGMKESYDDKVDKKKVLAPPIPLTQKKKTVKDFLKKEETELDEAKVYDPITKKMVARKPIKVQAGGGATRNGVPVETGPSKYKQSLKKEEVEQIDELSKKTLGSYVNKAAKDSRYMGQIATDFENQGDKARKQSKKDSFERLHRKYLGKSWKREAGIAKAVGKLTKEDVDKAWNDHANWAKDSIATGAALATKKAQEATARARKEDQDEDSDQQHDAHKEAARLHKQAMKHYAKGSDNYRHHEKMAKQHSEILGEEVQIDEVSKSTLMRYIPAAARAAAQHTYSGKEAQAWAGHHMRAGDYAASDRQLATSKSELGKSIKRIKGIDTATKKLGTQKECSEETSTASPVKTTGIPSPAPAKPKSMVLHKPASTKPSTKSYGSKPSPSASPTTTAPKQAAGSHKSPLSEDSYTSEYSYRWYTGADGKLHRRKYHPHKVKFKDSRLGTYRSTISTTKEETIKEDQLPRDEKWTDFIGKSFDHSTNLHKQIASTEDHEEKARLRAELSKHNKAILAAAKNLRGEK